MKIKGIVEEDYIQYRLPSMVIMMPYCNWKCGEDLCQNSPLALSKNIEINPFELIARYIQNPLTSAIVFSGLEPMMSFEDVIDFVELFRECSPDPIVIYTGYNKDEISYEIRRLEHFENIIIKFGRYIPNESYHFDNILGVSLASNNQYAEVIS